MVIHLSIWNIGYFDSVCSFVILFSHKIQYIISTERNESRVEKR